MTTISVSDPVIQLLQQSMQAQGIKDENLCLKSVLIYYLKAHNVLPVKQASKELKSDVLAAEKEYTEGKCKKFTSVKDLMKELNR